MPDSSGLDKHRKRNYDRLVRQAREQKTTVGVQWVNEKATPKIPKRPNSEQLQKAARKNDRERQDIEKKRSGRASSGLKKIFGSKSNGKNFGSNR